MEHVICVQVEIWEHISQALVEVGLSVAPSSSDKGETSSEEEEELVSYEGMLVSAAAAQRRQYVISHNRKRIPCQYDQCQCYHFSLISKTSKCLYLYQA